ncbi:hypothetical protein HD806DRAFT_519143 [Xylariaceae sp. AK1471]|nr:hypothetical protein HD806DRAFT_519143 [Xylariaceae sp. AK1471]
MIHQEIRISFSESRLGRHTQIIGDKDTAPRNAVLCSGMGPRYFGISNNEVKQTRETGMLLSVTLILHNHSISTTNSNPAFSPLYNARDLRHGDESSRKSLRSTQVLKVILRRAGPVVSVPSIPDMKNSHGKREAETWHICQEPIGRRWSKPLWILKDTEKYAEKHAEKGTVECRTNDGQPVSK